MRKRIAWMLGAFLLVGSLTGCETDTFVVTQESQPASEFEEPLNVETHEELEVQGEKLAVANEESVDQVAVPEETTKKFEVKEESVGDFLSWEELLSMPSR